MITRGEDQSYDAGTKGAWEAGPAPRRAKSHRERSPRHSGAHPARALAVATATATLAMASWLPGLANATPLAANPLAANPLAANPPAAPATPTPPTPADAAAQAAAAAQVAAAIKNVPLPPIPKVDRSLTEGQDPAALLARAIGLLTAGEKALPLEASLSGLRSGVTTQTVLANQASAVAAAADERGAKAAIRAGQLNASAQSLDGALRQATLTMYMSGRRTARPNLQAGNGDTVMAAVIGEQVALSPQGILGERRRAASEAVQAAAVARSEQATADAAAARAQQASSAAATEADALQGQLATLGAATAQTLQAESTAVSQNAGRSLATPTAFQFTPAAPLPPPVATSAVALTWLFSELGKSYVWGATGPDTFDCSGLTQFVWNKAGITTPRVAIDQDAWAVPVPLADIRPGDLAFFGADVHHMGMYIGGGLMINAPHTGDVVRVAPIWWSDLVGFGRPHSVDVPVPSRAPILPSTPNLVLPSLGVVPSQTAPPVGAAPITEPSPTKVPPLPTSTTVPSTSTTPSTPTSPVGSTPSSTTTPTRLLTGQ